MGQFDGLKQPDLQQACRDRGLSAAGSNAEMVDRLDEYELLIADGEAAAVPVVVGQPGPDVPPAPPVPDAGDTGGGPGPEPKPERSPSMNHPAVPTTTFRVRYSCPSELSTGLHLDFCRRALDDAAAAGHQTKGGAARIGFETIGGVRHAVYEVALRRR